MGIALLGPLTVDGDEGRLGPRDRVVLAGLAVRPGEVVAPDRLAQALWGETWPETWSKVVQGCVMRLRRVLGADAIETSARGYRLTVRAEDIDSQRFERLLGRGRELLTLSEPERAGYVIAEAMALWRGPALTELEEWDDGRTEGARLEELRRDAEELWMDAALRAGRCREVLSQLQTLVSQAPLRERRWALLALAHYQCGRQAEALRTLRQVRTVLATELALDPGPDLVALEQAILRQDPSLVAGAAMPEPSATCPYQGLVPYDVVDADAFFGRESEVRACLQKLAEHGALVVVGPSGNGKSSLVRAGVAANLERDGTRVVVITPGPHPMDALTAIPSRCPSPVLIVDQGEEMVTLCDRAEERAEFLRWLMQHAEHSRLVVAIRTDRLSEMTAYPAFARLVEQGLYLLGAMSTDDLRACIEGPAQQAGLLLEPGLVDLLLRDVEGEPGALPLLSHALRETWAHREGRTMTVAGYQATGGIRAAVARSAEEVYGSLPPDRQAIARSLLLRLVSQGPNGEPVRSRLPRRSLATDDEHAEILELLVSARLLTTDGDQLEVAHESLARAWPRLESWLEEDVEGRRILNHLAGAAEAWDTMGRPPSELYRGVRLAQALDWRGRPDPDLNPVEREFLQHSTAAADAELTEARERADREAGARRRTTRLASGLAVLLVLSVVIAGSALYYQQSAEDRAQEARAATTTADANRVAALSRSAGSLDLSLLLAAEALQIADTPATRDGLLDVLVEHRRATQVVRLGGSAYDAEVAADGETMFGSLFGGVVSWQSGSTAPALPVNRWFRPEDIATSPTDDLVALWSWKGGEQRVGVFSSDGTRQLELVGDEIGGEVGTFGFSPDGRRLLVLVASDASDGGPRRVVLRAVDVETGRFIGERLLHRGSVEDAWVTGTVADDASSAVAWSWDRRGTATYVDLGDGTRTLLEGGRRASDYEGYLALSVGAVKRWSDGALTVYDQEGRQIQVLEGHPTKVNDVVVAPDRTWAATGDEGGSIILWDIDPRTGTWSQRESLRGHDGAVRGLALDRAGTTLVSASADGTAISWDVSRSAGFGSLAEGPIAHQPWISNAPQTGAAGGLTVAPTRPGGLGSPGVVQALFWDPVSGEVVDRVDVGESLEGVAFGSSVTISPDHSMVAITHVLGAVVLDARTREELARIVLPRTETPNGTREPEYVWSSEWTPDGSRLLLGVEGEAFRGRGGDIVAVDTGTWQVQPERVRVGGRSELMELSPDRRLLAVGLSLTGLDNAPPPSVELRDPGTLEVRRVLRLDQGAFIHDLSFSPDAGLLAVGGLDGTLTVFDVDSGRQLRSPAKVHNDFIQQVEWLPDGRTVVTTGADGMVAMYDVERGLVRGRLPASSDATEDSTYLWSLTGQQITALVGGHDARTYPLDEDQWLDVACRIAGRDLTRDEWASYLPARPYHRTCGARD